jgi:hypothetical protein
VVDVRLGPRPAGGQTLRDGPRAAGLRGAGPSPGQPRPGVRRGADPGGKAFAIVTVLPTLVITAWLLAGLPLLLADRFFPMPMVLISVPLAAGLVLVVSRQLPSRWPGYGTRKRAVSTVAVTTMPLGEAAGLTAASPAAETVAIPPGGTVAVLPDGAAASPAGETGAGLADEAGAGAAGASADSPPGGGEAASAGGAGAGIAAGTVDGNAGATVDGSAPETVDGSAGGAPVSPPDGADGATASSPGETVALPSGETAVGTGGGTAAGTAGEAAASPAGGTAGVTAAGAGGGAAGLSTGRTTRPSAGRRANWSAWWGLAGTVVVAAGFAAWQFRVNSPQVIVIRDPGAFFQFGYWIAEHGSLPIPASLEAFGGSHPGLTFSSFGFVGHGGTVVPRLAAGLPIMLAAGLWAHGLPGGAAISPLLGAFAVLTVGGLTGRLAGPRWAPAGAFLLAITLPEAYTSRSAFSEILVQVLLFGGLCLAVDSLAHRQSRILAAFAGFALGLTVLAGIGSVVVLLPTIVFLGTLLAARRPQALPFGGGLLAGTGYGLVGGFVLAGPVMGPLAPGLGRVLLAAGGFLAVTLAGAAIGLVDPVRRLAVRLLRARPLRWLPDAAAVIVVVAAAGFAARPYLRAVDGPADAYVAALQRISELPVDPHRLYSEDSLYWVIWYLGAPALLLGVAGLAVVTRRCLRALITWRDRSRAARAWALPLMIIGWGTVTVLWQPGTLPDQPWASRQFVPVLLPGLIVAAVWVCALLAARARARGAGLAAVSAAVACFVAALAVPPVITTFGIGARPATSPALHPASTGLARQRTGAGELAAVRDLCGAIPAGSSVLLLDQEAAQQFTQVVRGMCGDAAGVMAGATPAEVAAAVGGIVRAGHQAVLLATRPAELTPYRAAPRQVVNLTTTQDPHVLTKPPASVWPIRYVLWMSAPGAGGGL